MSKKMTEIERNLLREIADLHKIPEGAYNIRKDGELDGRNSTANIEIASILARNASLMIFDEPEAGIDLWSFAKLTETFENIHRNSDSTIIIISHQERIIRLADELILVSGGSVTKRGSVADVFPDIMDDTKIGCTLMEADK